MVVTVISIIVAFAGCLLFIVLKLFHQPVPLWDDLLLGFGIVFVCALLFDRVGRQTAQFRDEKDAMVASAGMSHAVWDSSLPTPLPCLAPIGSQVLPHQVGIARVREDAESQKDFLMMRNHAVAELHALGATYFNVDADSSFPARNPRKDVFYILFEGNPVGFCEIEMTAPYIRIQLLYVKSAYRRRTIGSTAYMKLVEFVKLLGNVTEILAECSVKNMRGQRFYESLGFQTCSQMEIEIGNPDGTSMWNYVL